MKCRNILHRRIGAPHQKCLRPLCQGQRFAKRRAFEGLCKQPATAVRRVLKNVTEIVHGSQSVAQSIYF
jgi:hypothetical protein